MKADPERAARDMLDRHAVTAPPVDVEGIVRVEDILIARHGSHGREVGFLLWDSDRRIIGINSYLSARRQRLAIAHELGHRALHGGRRLILCKDIRPADADSLPSMASLAEEAEANAFAGALLMPAQLVRLAVGQALGAVSAREDLMQRLAAEFDVGTRAVAWRLLNLGVLT